MKLQTTWAKRSKSGKSMLSCRLSGGKDAFSLHYKNFRKIKFINLREYYLR